MRTSMHPLCSSRPSGPSHGTRTESRLWLRDEEVVEPGKQQTSQPTVDQAIAGADQDIRKAACMEDVLVGTGYGLVDGGAGKLCLPGSTTSSSLSQRRDSASWSVGLSPDGRLLQSGCMEDAHFDLEMQQSTMANLTLLVYGMQLCTRGRCSGELEELAMRRTSRCLLEGSSKLVRGTVQLSIEAFFDFYPEI